MALVKVTAKRVTPELAYLGGILDQLVINNSSLPSSFGQAVMAGSLPVVIASDQTPVKTLNSISGALDGDIVPSNSRNANVGITPVIMINGASNIYGWNIVNKGASTIYVKLYDKTISPTVGTDIPIETIPVQVGAIIYGSDVIRRISNICWAAVTGGAADNDTTAPSGNAIVSINYKS